MKSVFRVACSVLLVAREVTEHGTRNTEHEISP
jgi:hypothetical protein